MHMFRADIVAAFETLVGLISNEALESESDTTHKYNLITTHITAQYTTQHTNKHHITLHRVTEFQR